MSTRRSHLTLVAAIVAGLAFVAFLAIPGSPLHKKPTLGLDLQGGLEVVLKAEPDRGQKLTSADLDRSVQIMRNRVDKLGVSEPEIRKQPPDQIVIELPGVKNAADASKLLGKTALLELYDLETSLVTPSISASGVPVPQSSLYTLLNSVKAKAATGRPEAFYLFDDKHRIVVGPLQTKAQLEQRANATLAQRVNAAKAARKPLPKGPRSVDVAKLPKGWTVLGVPPKTTVVSCSPTSATVCPPGQEPTGTTYFLFKREPKSTARGGPWPQMTGDMLKLSGTRQDFDPTTGEAIVTMQFTGKGNKRFKDITRAEAVRGATLGQPQHFAIVLDNEIRSFPQIDYQKYPDGIDPTGGGAQITGMTSTKEAKNLAIVLQTGALPVKFRTIERTDVSATLGKDSLDQAKKAAIGGLIIVALFLLLMYRFLGLVAVIGLGIYAAFMYGAILLLNVTLTLPGFAGMILTIGVAADANIVIFERIKEESRAGKSVRAAIASGYAKGFHTIIDANVVTAITALILFAVATAGVKGFALMLLIGTALSLVTAVVATRAMLGLLAGFRWFDNPRFMGASATQHGRWLQIDFMRRRYQWFAISGAFILICLVALGVRGLNLGIDFKGGTQITFKTPAPTSLSDVRDQMAKIGKADAVVQGRGKLTGAESYKQFQVRTKSLTSGETSTISDDLQSQVNAESLGIKNVSSSFGRQIAKSAILAIIVSIFLIILYIAFRFDRKYSGPVIVAMLHDVVITVGFYALVGREVTASTVAAILTVLGYSIYDTIIIFDRIRENTPLMRRASFATIANVSLWETIRRSLATSFITLLPVGSLFLFGGATLQDFAFALLVGITAGAYSSIFIAAPLLTILKEREPEFARRKDVPMETAEGDLVFEEAEAAAAAAPAPSSIADPVGTAEHAISATQAKREKRRQRRRARPHGRAR
jgi:SecD/SecF fusion protein